MALSAAAIYPPQSTKKACQQAHEHRAADPFKWQAVFVLFMSPLEITNFGG